MKKKGIDVKELEKCGICFKKFEENDNIISLCFYDEVVGKDEVRVLDAYQLLAYHKSCSPLNINKEVYEKIGGR